jgi:hypothetical protein
MQHPRGPNANEGLLRGLKRFLDQPLLADPRRPGNQPRLPRSKRGNELAQLPLPAD